MNSINNFRIETQKKYNKRNELSQDKSNPKLYKYGFVQLLSIW